MKRVFVILMAIIWIASVVEASAQSSPIPPSAPPTVAVQQETMQVALREEQDNYVVALFKIDQQMIGSIFMLCSHTYGWMQGTVCTQPQQMRPEYAGIGDIRTLSIQVFKWIEQSVTLYQIQGGSARSLVTINLNQDYSPNLTVAAFELPTVSNDGSAQTLLRVVGSFDPSRPATIFAGHQQITVKTLSTIQSAAPGSPRESTLSLDDSVTQHLPKTYPLTICQYGMCQTVTVQHVNAHSGGGRG